MRPRVRICTTQNKNKGKNNTYLYIISTVTNVDGTDGSMVESKMFHKKVGKTLKGSHSEYNEYKCYIRYMLIENEDSMSE